MGRGDSRNPSEDHKIMTQYRRYRLKGGCYFITVNLAERNRELLTERIDILRESFRLVKNQHPYHWTGGMSLITDLDLE
jgi:hypothetical protein